jgi:hypothetical protein
MEKEMPVDSDIKIVSDIRSGLAVARTLAGKKGRIVSAGSIVLAGEVLKELGFEYPVPSTQYPGSEGRG